MHPIIMKIGFITIYSYGVMVALGFLIAVLLAAREAKKRNICPDIIFNLSFTILFCGIIGARIVYVLLNLKYYMSAPLEILFLHQGGLVFYGGLFFGVIGAIIYLKNNKLPALEFSDLLMPYLALAQSIGRIGCFLNGCCYGRPCDFILGVRFPGTETLLHPAQAYESFMLLFIFLLLLYIRGRQRFAGQIFITYFILYAVLRFVIEFFRGDNPRIFFGLTIAQVISIVIFIVAITAGILIKRCKSINLMRKQKT